MPDSVRAAKQRAAYNYARASGFTRSEAKRFSSVAQVDRKLGRGASPRVNDRAGLPKYLSYPYQYVIRIKIGTPTNYKFKVVTVVNDHELDYDEIAQQLEDEDLGYGETILGFAILESTHFTG